jgi:hypothetical protein
MASREIHFQNCLGSVFLKTPYEHFHPILSVSEAIWHIQPWRRGIVVTAFASVPVDSGFESCRDIGFE